MKMIQSGKKNGNMGYFIYGFTVEGYNAWAADRLQKKKPLCPDGQSGLMYGGNYLAALAALIASMRAGTTLNRSPSMP